MVNLSHGQLDTAIFCVMSWRMAYRTFVTSWPPTWKGSDTLTVRKSNATDQNMFKNLWCQCSMHHNGCLTESKLVIQSIRLTARNFNVIPSHHQLIVTASCLINVYELHPSQPLTEILLSVLSVVFLFVLFYSQFTYLCYRNVSYMAARPPASSQPSS